MGTDQVRATQRGRAGGASVTRANQALQQVLAREQAARQEAEAAAELVRRLQIVTDATLAPLTSDDLTSELLDRIVEVLEVDTASILTLDRARGALVVRARKGLPFPEEPADPIPIGLGFTGQIAASCQPLVVDDADRMQFYNRAFTTHGIRSLVGVPLFVEGEVTGVLHVGTKTPRHFTGDDVRLLQLVADRVALALDRARLYEVRCELERRKDEFISHVSHEMRTPLAVITASLGVVLANEPGDLPEPLHRMLANAEHAAARMAHLVTDMIELARFHAGQIQLRRMHCDLRDVAGRAARAIEPIAREQEQAIELQVPADPLLAEVDADRIERCLINLLGNAQKFGPRGRPIRLRLTRVPGEARFAVSDDGPGIPEWEQAIIFDRFYRSDLEATERNQGSGLGLPIARAIVELHGGQIWVESTPGHGATFWISLPLRGSGQNGEIMEGMKVKNGLG